MLICVSLPKNMDDFEKLERCNKPKSVNSTIELPGWKPWPMCMVDENLLLRKYFHWDIGLLMKWTGTDSQPRTRERSTSRCQLCSNPTANTPEWRCLIVVWGIHAISHSWTLDSTDKSREQCKLILRSFTCYEFGLGTTCWVCLNLPAAELLEFEGFSRGDTTHPIAKLTATISFDGSFPKKTYETNIEHWPFFL